MNPELTWKLSTTWTKFLYKEGYDAVLCNLYEGRFALSLSNTLGVVTYDIFSFVEQ